MAHPIARPATKANRSEAARIAQLEQRLQTGPLRIALFADSFDEANGVATLCRNLVQYTKHRGLPFLCVRGGDCTNVQQQGLLTTVELHRSLASFPLDKDLYFDPLLSRYKRLVVEELLKFDPDLIHITGPGDLGFLGFWLAHVIGVPVSASWHTNLHEYASKRLEKTLSFAPCRLRTRAGALAEHHSLRGLIRFYRMPHFLMAPNPDACELLEERAHRPAFLMPHGVDTHLFSPSVRNGAGKSFCIGYVGRLTPEKNVRAFVDIERHLLAAGYRDFEFLLVGDGSERDWLNRHLRFKELPGVLRNGDLANAYSRMDAFVFPSRTDSFGLVLLEASASGVPVVAPPLTGARAGLEDRVNAILDDDLSHGVGLAISQPAIRERIGCSARQFACSHDWSSVFDRLYELFRLGLEIEDTRQAAHDLQPLA